MKEKNKYSPVWINNTIDKISNTIYKPSTPQEDISHSTRKTVIVGVFILFLFFGVFGIWSSVVHLDSYVVANGMIQIKGEYDNIQHLEGGIINTISVEQGDHVKEGQILMTLDDINIKASLIKAQDSLFSLEVYEDRLTAERDKLNSWFYFSTQTHIKEDFFKQVVSTQMSLFNSRKSSLDNRMMILNNRIDQYNTEILGLQSQLDVTNKQKKLIQEELGNKSKLVKDGVYERLSLIPLEKQMLSTELSEADLHSNIARIKQKIHEVDLEMLNLRESFDNEILNEIKTIQLNIKELKENILTLKNSLEHTIISAPRSGVLNYLYYNTVGGVILPGSQVATIVPDDYHLVIKAQINPQDIAALLKAQTSKENKAEIDGETGIKSKIRITAFGNHKLGMVDALCTYVSPSLVENYYLATLMIPNDDISELESRDINLYPGMPVNVYISTGSRTFLSYLLSPILMSINDSFRES